jgi:outer membrane immunogenic protein
MAQADERQSSQRTFGLHQSGQLKGGEIMKTWIAAVAFAALSTSALAADMQAKGPPPMARAPNWTGCYIGGNGGAAWSNYTGTFLTTAGMPLPVPMGLGSAGGSAGSYGGQIGCDYQFDSNWVVGLRGMWDGTTAKASLQGSEIAGAALIVSSLSPETTAFGTAVARIGYDVSPALMFYGVGGVAFAQNKYTQNITTAAASLNFISSDAPTGWTAGAGASWMLGPNWDFWVEYDFLGFPNRTVTTVGLVSTTNTVSQNVQTILAGLDFRVTNWAANEFGLR